MRLGLWITFLIAAASTSHASERIYRIEITVTSKLPAGNVPMDPRLDLGRVIRDAGAVGVLDPNSIEVFNATTGKPIPFARTDDFAYGDAGRIEWVIANPEHRKYEVRFRDAPTRPALVPQLITPRIGTGDLLRYNAGQPRPIELYCPARLIDLTGDGKPDLVGSWNYAYRPGDPWSGIVCYPRVGDDQDLEFGDLVRVRRIEKRGSQEFRHFEQTYSGADFADFDGDGLVDIAYCPSNSDQLFFYANTGERDAGGMPVFVAVGQVPRQTAKWEHFQAVDLDCDGKMDLIVGNLWLRNEGNGQGLPTFATIAALDAGDVRCFFDVDGDKRLDAITLEKNPGEGLSNFSVAYCLNRGGDMPQFDVPRPLDEINAAARFPVDVTAVTEGPRRGLLVTQQHWETMRLFEHAGAGSRFRPAGLATSKSAVLGLGDQAWPCVCDWDGDGDLDLLVGGGYGWPRIVINDGTNRQPAYRPVEFILADGQPIRITRNEVLGTSNWHDMGYPYPEYVDWDGDGLPDLILPNETNRIFWYKNTGTRSAPRFGPRQQLVCDGNADSPEKRAKSAALADEPTTPHAPYPFEHQQPFNWRTRAAIGDFNGDRLADLVTADGLTRKATLFAQHKSHEGPLRLQKECILTLTDGRAVEPSLIDGGSGWTEGFQAIDWDNDGLMDLIYSHAGRPRGGSIQLLRNAGTRTRPEFDPPRPLMAYGTLINISNHGPHPWAGDLDGDGMADLLACVEWSVFPFFAHNAIEMDKRPSFTIHTRVTDN